MRRPASLVLLAAAALLGVAGCDAAPGTGPLTPAAVVVSDLAITPDTVRLGPAETTRTVDIGVSVAVTGAPQTVTARLRPQFSDAPLATATLQEQGGRYVGTLTADLGRGETGFYPVLVTATTPDGRLSNRAETLFTFVAPAQGPPTVERVTFPDPFSAPGSLRFVATVSDPDGAVNIARVTVETPSGLVFDLSDTGPSAGDPDDGTFSVAFEFGEDDLPAGTYPFTFRASDRDGLDSDPLTVTVTAR